MSGKRRGAEESPWIIKRNQRGSRYQGVSSYQADLKGYGKATCSQGNLIKQTQSSRFINPNPKRLTH